MIIKIEGVRQFEINGSYTDRAVYGQPNTQNTRQINISLSGSREKNLVNGACAYAREYWRNDVRMPRKGHEKKPVYLLVNAGEKNGEPIYAQYTVYDGDENHLIISALAVSVPGGV